MSENLTAADVSGPNWLAGLAPVPRVQISLTSSGGRYQISELRQGTHARVLSSSTLRVTRGCASDSERGASDGAGARLRATTTTRREIGACAGLETRGCTSLGARPGGPGELEVLQRARGAGALEARRERMLKQPIVFSAAAAQAALEEEAPAEALAKVKARCACCHAVVCGASTVA